jgi:hypothetical protein
VLPTSSVGVTRVLCRHPAGTHEEGYIKESAHLVSLSLSTADVPGGGSDLEDWEIGTIVGSILGGLLLLAVLMAVAVIILLLIISPRRTMQKMRSGSTSSSDNEAPVNPIAPPPTENHRNSMIM